MLSRVRLYVDSGDVRTMRKKVRGLPDSTITSAAATPTAAQEPDPTNLSSPLVRASLASLILYSVDPLSDITSTIRL
jgi:hypothetical protein